MDVDPGAVPVWDTETRATYDRFIESGGDAATWNQANPDLPAPASAPTAPKRPATHPADAGLLRWAGAAWDYAQARALAGFQRSARGRQGR